MKKLTNYTPGPRGVTMKDGEVVWIKPGETAEVDETKIVAKPDLGTKPAAEADLEDEANAALKAENAELKKRVASLEADLEKVTKPAK